MSKGKVADTKQKQAPAPEAKGFRLFGKTIVFSQEEKICYLLLLLLLVVIYNIRSKFSMIPFERDEGIYSYFGKLLLEGKTPYIDFMEVKFPGLFYFYAVMVGLFGDTVKDIHMGFAWLNMASIVLIFFTARNLFSPTAGLISAVTFGFVSMTANLSGFTVQSEHGVAFFTSLGLLFYTLTRKNGKWYYFFLMGISMGMAFLIKTNGVFLCLWGAVVIVTDFLLTRPRNFKTFF